MVEGLNRTSVGLKQGPLMMCNSPLIRPQSNQRGIETRPWRVSVRDDHDGPQSNQRGIETTVYAECLAGHRAGLNRTSVGLKRRTINLGRPERVVASIEPAWD